MKILNRFCKQYQICLSLILYSLCFFSIHSFHFNFLFFSPFLMKSNRKQFMIKTDFQCFIKKKKFCCAQDFLFNQTKPNQNGKVQTFFFFLFSYFIMLIVPQAYYFLRRLQQIPCQWKNRKNIKCICIQISYLICRKFEIFFSFVTNC